MQIVITILIFIMVLYCLISYEHKQGKRKLKQFLRENYGKKPARQEYDFKKVGMYWNQFGEFVQEDEKIDEVTWNDLEMNQVFNRINNCSSFTGEQLLYSTLHCLPKNEEYSKKLEGKIEYFASNSKEREAIQTELSRLGKDELSYYLPFFMGNFDTLEIKGIWFYRILQILLVLSTALSFIIQNQICIIFAVGIYLINLVIYSLKKLQNEINFNSILSMTQLIRTGNKIADSKRTSYEEQFGKLRGKVDLFQKLTRMVGRAQNKKEMGYSGEIFAVVFDYMIGATLWDFTICAKIMSVIRDKQHEYKELYLAIGEIDMAISIASFRESLPYYCTPVFCKESKVHMDELYHPLIDEPVSNCFDMSGNCMITGSNASGKSTFIKAVVINVILAQSIHTCMAHQMVLPYARIITSMAVRDDLMEGESYYIKEIKYLNRIIQSLSKERFVICAIDEILRGTNTEERIAASAAILNYLNHKNCIAIVATHDIEMTQILKDSYENYHFQEEIQEKDIVFDYKIYPGVSTSKNAIKLLEYVGFPTEIIENAQKGY